MKLASILFTVDIGGASAGQQGGVKVNTKLGVVTTVREWQWRLLRRDEGASERRIDMTLQSLDLEWLKPFVGKLRRTDSEGDSKKPRLTYSGYPFQIPVLEDIWLDEAIDGQGVLMSRFPTDRRYRGLFKDAFRELSEITKDYEDVRLATIERIVVGQKARRTEAFEVFGARVPAEGTARWGLLVVVGLQMYFWLHLRAFASRIQPNDSAWDVAWIGLYGTRWSRAVLVVSGYVLPVIVVALLALRRESFRHLGWEWGGAVLSALWAMASCYCWSGRAPRPAPRKWIP